MNHTRRKNRIIKRRKTQKGGGYFDCLWSAFGCPVRAEPTAEPTAELKETDSSIGRELKEINAALGTRDPAHIMRVLTKVQQQNAERLRKFLLEYKRYRENPVQTDALTHMHGKFYSVLKKFDADIEILKKRFGGTGSSKEHNA
jgi:hypothetical protein